jgi:enterochelin esterase family protein
MQSHRRPRDYHRFRLIPLAAVFTLAWGAAACGNDADSPQGEPGGVASTPASGSGGSAGHHGGSDSQPGGGGTGAASIGGTSDAASGHSNGGSQNGGNAGSQSGGGGSSSGGNPSGGASAGDGQGGQSGGAAGTGGSAGAPTGTCPTTLPKLAADGDTAFYADRQGIPHGQVKAVQYKSGVAKTMHVYTPPDYETNTTATYPALYINHGGGEGDSHWGCTNDYNCGYAGRILDNLLADGKAVPMLIVMPDTGDCANFNPPKPPAFDDPCTTQYVNDFIPYVEKTYRVKADRHSRAIAGLSMGGLVTLTTGFAHLELFSHVFVYSSGYTADARPQWETNLSGVLGDSKATNQLLDAPVYLAAGATDIALENAKAVRDIFEKHDIKVLWQDSSLGHEWGNWRRYLAQTLPLMFKNTSGCE